MSGASGPGLARIEGIFAALRNSNRRALLPFVTAGYPDLKSSFDLLPGLARAGGSIIEIGFPFSDPIADGPVIAESMHEALQKGCSVTEIFSQVKRVRPSVTAGLVAMVSCSIVERVGPREFVQQAAQCGIDGLIVPDLPLEESAEIRALCGEAGMACIMLIAPTTAPERAAELARASTGFVYLLARTGITGVRNDTPDVSRRVAELRKVTALPIACGFGIGTPEAVREVTRHAEGAIVGSAIIRHMQSLLKESASRERLVAETEAFVERLAGGLGS